MHSPLLPSFPQTSSLRQKSIKTPSPGPSSGTQQRHTQGTNRRNGTERRGICSTRLRELSKAHVFPPASLAAATNICTAFRDKGPPKTQAQAPMDFGLVPKSAAKCPVQPLPLLPISKIPILAVFPFICGHWAVTALQQGCPAACRTRPVPCPARVISKANIPNLPCAAQTF